MPVEGLFLPPASIQAQNKDNSERNTQKWNSNKKDYLRKKPLRHGCDWGDLVELSFAKHNVLQRCVSKLLNKPSYGRQNQTNRHNMFWEKSAMKSYYNVWLTFVMLHRVEIAFLFISFKLLQLEHEQILLDLDLPQINLWIEFHSRKAALKASGMSFLGQGHPTSVFRKYLFGRRFEI